MESFINLDAGFFLHRLPNGTARTARIERESQILHEDWTYCALIHDHHWPLELADLVRQYARPTHASVWCIPRFLRGDIDVSPAERVRAKSRLDQQLVPYLERQEFPIRRGDIIRLVGTLCVLGFREMTHNLIFDGQAYKPLDDGKELRLNYDLGDVTQVRIPMVSQ